MSEEQPLGGTRRLSPVEDEDCYPLTHSEYLTIKDNLVNDQLTNWESFLLSTFITSLISAIVFYCTGSFSETVIDNNVEKSQINYSQIIILIVYVGISIGTLIGFVIFRITKKKNNPTIDRLNKKISHHLNKRNE